MCLYGIVKWGLGLLVAGAEETKDYELFISSARIRRLMRALFVSQVCMYIILL